MALLPLEPGYWSAELEKQATAILMADREAQGVAMRLKTDWLNEEQSRLRREREVYSESPIDRLLYSGLYRRAYNPLFGKRPTSRGRYSLMQDPWSQDSFDSFGWDSGFWLPSYSRVVDRIVEGGHHYTWDIMLPIRDGVSHRSLAVVEVQYEHVR